jgi:predicted amidophosphoribosyltransferase
VLIELVLGLVLAIGAVYYVLRPVFRAPVGQGPACGRCGAPLAAEARFCSRCGAPVAP